MKISDQVDKFYREQNRIILIGGLITIVLLLLILISPLFIILSVVSFSTTMLICDRREKVFKKNLRDKGYETGDNR